MLLIIENKNLLSHLQCGFQPGRFIQMYLMMRQLQSIFADFENPFMTSQSTSITH